MRGCTLCRRLGRVFFVHCKFTVYSSVLVGRSLGKNKGRYGLLISPYANEGGGQSSGEEPSDEEDRDHTLGELVLLAVQRVHVGSLQPVRA